MGIFKHLGFVGYILCRLSYSILTKLVLEYKTNHGVEYNAVTPTADFNGILRNRFFFLVKTIKSTRQMKGLKLLLLLLSISEVVTSDSRMKGLGFCFILMKKLKISALTTFF